MLRAVQRPTQTITCSISISVPIIGIVRAADMIGTFPLSVRNHPASKGLPPWLSSLIMGRIVHDFVGPRVCLIASLAIMLTMNSLLK